MMKSRFFKRAIIVCAALVTLNPVLGDEFQNSVVNIKFDKDVNNNIKINLVTSKPYSRPLFINKKQDNQYVILLPETKNCMCGQPVINDLSGLVSGVTIKTQPYMSSGAKGYTKITITAPQPINLRAVTSVSVQGSALATKPVQTPQPSAKPVATVASGTAKTTAATLKSIESQNQVKIITKKDSTKEAQIAQNTTQNAVKQKSVSETAKVQSSKTVEKTKPQVKTETTKVAAVPQIPLESKAKTIENLTFPQPNILIKEKKNLENELKKESVEKPTVKESNEPEVTFMDVVHEKCDTFANLVKLHSDLLKLILIISAIGFPLLVIFYIVILNRRIKERIDETMVENMQEQLPDDTQTIDTPVDVPVYEDVQEPPAETHTEDVTFADYMNKPIDEVDKVIEEDFVVDEKPIEETVGEVEVPVYEEEIEPAEEVIEEIAEEFVDEVVEEFAEEFVDEVVEEDFVVDEEPIEETIEEVEVPEYEEEIEPTEEVVEEFVDEVVEEDFVVDEEPIEEMIEEVELPAYEEEIEPVEEVIDEVVDEVVEEDFVIDEELVEETVEEVEVPELEEEIEPAEEVVEEFAEEFVEEVVEETVEEDYEPDGFIDDFTSDGDDDSIFDELLESPVEETVVSDITSEENNDDNVFDELIHEEEEPETTEDGLVVLDRTSIDDKSGFYLVNFENFTSLIGYIDDEIFVLKTFDTFVNNHIYIKVAETVSSHVIRYIVKVGLYKMVIEVTPDKMSHLIDL